MNTEFITKPATQAASRILENKHTSIAACVYVSAKVLCHIGAVWFPTHSEQFKQTADIIESGAVGYGFLMSGNKTTTENKQ
jgi:hypothetical protein